MKKRHLTAIFLLTSFLVEAYPASAETPTFRKQQGVFVLEGKNLRKLPQKRAELKTNKGRKVASFLMPGIDEKKTVLLRGRQAKLRLRTNKPTFYIHLPAANQYQFDLVRLKPKQSAREISEVLISPLKGDVEKKSDPVFSHVRSLNAKLYKLTPAEPLTPGEYGLVRLPRTDPFDTKQVAVELDIWDFGVDPPRKATK